MKTLATLLFAFLLKLQLWAQVPAITTFSPATGPVETIVTIYGINFGATPVNNIVFFGAVRASTITATPSSLTLWNDPANRSCLRMPDYNTDVVINAGTIVIKSNVTIRSLTINPGATITVNAGFNLTVLH